MAREIFTQIHSLLLATTIFLTSPTVTARVINLPEIDPEILYSIDSVQPDTSGYVMDKSGVALVGGALIEDDWASTPERGKKIKKLLEQADRFSSDFFGMAPSFSVGSKMKNGASSAPPQYSFNNCHPFALGSGKAVNLDSAQQVCVNTYSSEPIKLQSVILNQSTGSDFDLAVFFYNHETDSAEFKGGSASTGNTDEIYNEVMPAGNYILYAVPRASVTNVSFVIGALGWGNYDSYEPNDRPDQAKQFAGEDSNYVIIGNADNVNDRDYFLYTSAPNQDIVNVKLRSTTHVLEVATAGTWLPIANAGQYQPLRFENPGDSVLLRVRPADGSTVDPLINYQLAVTAPAVSLKDYSIAGDVNPGWFPGTEIHTTLTFKGTAIDALNHKVPFAQNIHLGIKSEDVEIRSIANVDENGKYSDSLSVPVCDSQESERVWDHQYDVCWEVEYHYKSSDTWSFGVDELPEPGVRYHHVCSSRLLSGVDWQHCQ